MRWIVAILFILITLFVGLQFVPVAMFDVITEQSAIEPQAVTDTADSDSVPTQIATVPDDRPVVTHVAQPDQVKAIYMSACVAGTPSFRDELVAFISETEINSLVIDIKDASGSISFDPVGAEWQSAWQAAECGARDMHEFIAHLHEQNIYVIGRVSVFQDSLYTQTHPEYAVKTADGARVWRDHKGISFIDVAAQSYWERILDLSIESYNIGFDEINFDYIRYPSDGDMTDISFPVSAAGEFGLNKAANLEAFFAYLGRELRDPAHFAAMNHTGHGRATATPYFSGDLFGMTTTSYDDLSIGQVLDRAIPYFDVIAPMVYPSHYPPNFMNLGNPNDMPYEIVYAAMLSAVDRLAATTSPIDAFTHTRLGTTTPAIYTKSAYSPTKLRTWIQDFDYGGDYDAADVRAQIQASYDAGVDSWMVWAPSNRYTRAAYLDAE